MKKALKIFSWSLAMITIVVIGSGIYMYNSNPFIKAVVDNDESKLFYFPVKEEPDLSGFNYEEIPLKVTDTTIIYGYFFRSKTDTIKASIFFLHGAGGNVGKYTKMFTPLVENGFQVYAIDWRGFGKSEEIPTHANVLEDTRIAFQNMLQRVDVKHTNIVVLGQSLGGQVAVRLTKEFQQQIDALILDGSIISFPTVAADNTPINFLKRRAENNPGNFNQPYIAFEDIKGIENTPKLIIQSLDDRNVPPVRGKVLFNNAKEPKEYWQTEGDHIHTLINYPNETIRKIENLLTASYTEMKE